MDKLFNQDNTIEMEAYTQMWRNQGKPSIEQADKYVDKEYRAKIKAMLTDKKIKPLKK